MGGGGVLLILLGFVSPTAQRTLSQLPPLSIQHPTSSLPALGLPWAATADSGQPGTHPAGFSTASNPRLNSKPRFGVLQGTVLTQPGRGHSHVKLTLSRDALF